MTELQLPTVKRQTARLHNLLIGLAREVSVQIGKCNYAFTFSAEMPENVLNAGIAGTFREHGFEILLPRLPEISLFTSEYPEFEWSGMEDELRVIFLDSIARSVFQVIEKELNGLVIIKTVSCDKQQEMNLDKEWMPFILRGEAGEVALEGVFGFDAYILDLLEEKYRGLVVEVPEAYDDLAIDLYLILARETLKLSEWRSLSSGDIILLPDTSGFKKNQYSLIAANRYLFEAVYEKGKMTTKSDMNEIESREEDESMEATQDLDEHETAPVVEEQEEPVDALSNQYEGVDDLPIQLVFEVGHKKIKLGDLKSIQPGYTFEMSNPVDMPVSIRANGKVIGNGQLINLGNRIGVQLKQLKKHV